MMEHDLAYDAIVIGAGHNGLVAAAYLAEAGKRVLVLEAGNDVGGAAVTAEIAPDYMSSAGAHLLYAWPQRIEKDLKLAKHGFEMASRDMVTVALDKDGKHLVLPASSRADIARLKDRSPRDAEAYGPFMKRVQRYAGLLQPLLEKGLPVPGEGAKQAATDALSLIWRFEKMGEEDRQELGRFLPASMAQVLDRTFEDPLLKAALAMDATLGHHMGPKSPGSAYQYIYRLAQQNIAGGKMGYPAGGIGALPQALARLIGESEGRVRTNSQVRHILVSPDGKTEGVVLTDGTKFHAPVVLSSLDPRRTYLDLLGSAHLAPEQTRRLGSWRMQGACAKINLALEGLPIIEGLEEREYGGRWLIAPDMTAMERAFVAAKRNELAVDPIMEIVLPSYHDPRAAPPGHHTMSILLPHVPYELEGGWEARRDEFTKRVVDAVAVYAPDIKIKLIAGEILTPPEIERRFGAPGAGWHQGDMSLDQTLLFRPGYGLSHDEGPVEGLYLCGSGTHPGGGLTGEPGRLAAAHVLEGGSAHV
jgi:phytoene dehydrogenase-like protein